MTNCGGKKFHQGHTCGDCQRTYYARHAHSCTWGVDPRLQACDPPRMSREKDLERLISELEARSILAHSQAELLDQARDELDKLRYRLTGDYIEPHPSERDLIDD